LAFSGLFGALLAKEKWLKIIVESWLRVDRFSGRRKRELGGGKWFGITIKRSFAAVGSARRAVAK